MNIQLKFEIEKVLDKNYVKNAFIIYPNDESYTKNKLNIDPDIDLDDLLKYASKHTKNLKFKKKHNKLTLTFDKGDKILSSYYLKNKIFDLKKIKKSKLVRIIIGGTAIGLITSALYSSIKTDEKGDKSNNKTIEKNIDNKQLSRNITLSSLNLSLKYNQNDLFNLNLDKAMLEKKPLNIVLSKSSYNNQNNDDITNNVETTTNAIGETTIPQEVETEQIQDSAETTVDFSNDVELINDNFDNYFSFEYKDQTTSENVSNSKKYQYLYEKYGQQYGIDPNLLMAMVSQESSGIHKEYDGGRAIGAMQIQDIWDGLSVTAYNFNTNSYETEVINWMDMQNLDKNIKIGAMIFASYLKELNYDLPKTIAGYNIGITAIKSMGEDWIDEISDYSSGDNEYYKKVFSFLPDGQVLSVKNVNGNTISYKIDNELIDEYVPSMTR